MRWFNLFKVFVACLVISGVAYAQGVGSSGDIRGIVTDPTGAVIANGTVTVVDVSKGAKHTTATDGDGTYRLTLLPAVYSVTVAKSGFQTEIARTVTVTIG